MFDNGKARLKKEVKRLFIIYVGNIRFPLSYFTGGPCLYT